MTKYTLNLPSHSLKVVLSRKRKSLKVPSLLEELKREIGNIRTGNRISRAVRVVTDRLNIKAILGGNIALMVLSASLIAPLETNLAEANSLNVEAESRFLQPMEQTLITQVVIRYPVNKPYINQGYSFFHPGLDIDGEIGDPVFPIENGVVEAREFSKFGYGNSVIVDHQNGLKSRYAHLSKITVFEGDEVNTKTELGDVGSTGRSTGPHLHLEVYKDGKAVNPQTVLGSAVQVK